MVVKVLLNTAVDGKCRRCPSDKHSVRGKKTPEDREVYNYAISLRLSTS
jgi:hypothetical protein